MKVVNRLIGFPLVVVVMISAAAAVMAQQPAATENTSRPRVASTPPATQEKAKEPGKKPATLPTGERLEPDDPSRVATDVPTEVQANRKEQLSEENDVVPVYNNFFNTYRLGPE